MVLNHRKKSSRHRGTWTHGHGEKKKHRGAGSRGGRGNAGSGKRSDTNKPSFWKIKNFYGKHGFTNPTTKKVNTLSLSQLSTSIEKYVAAGTAVKSGDVYKLNIADIKASKLLGTGNVLAKFEIVCEAATPKAISKVEALGGSVIVKAKEVKKTPEAKDDKPSKE